MALAANARTLTLLGFVLWGDLGPLTIYRSHRRPIVFFPRTYPEKPTSPNQQLQRDCFKVAAYEWTQVPQTTRDVYELACRQGRLHLTGYNLWMHAALTPDKGYLTTIERQTGLTLPRPSPSYP